MFSFFKKSVKIDFVMDSIAEQCIPYACHYDDHSILTKNGELMQVIKIEGLAQELIQSDSELDLRGVIRKAIMSNINNRNVAIWFHTIRRKHNLDSINYFSWVFARDNHDGWVKKNHWSDKFVNELYITILYEGDGNDKFALALAPKLLKKYHMNKLDKNAQILDALMTKVLAALQMYGGKRLAIIHDHVGAHCEILEFLSKVVCLQSKRVAVPIMGLDQIFCQSKIAFGGNTLEVLDDEDKNYAAIFTIKEYHEFAAKALDKLLRTSSEYVITQTLNFTDSKLAKKNFEYFNYILKVSKDEALREYCGLQATMDSDHGNVTDYATQQMSIMIIGNSLDELNAAVTNVIKEFHKLGIAVIREDLNIALSYWSQLPGNFSFFRRASFINTMRTAGFASLHNTPSGKIENIWGPALTIFRRENGAPHFFSLYVGKTGHSLVAGLAESAKSTLVNFLLSEATKYDPNIFYIDQFENSRVTLKALGGRYEFISFENKKPSFSLNPFDMQDSDENRQFLLTWLLLLLFPAGDHTKAQENNILVAINELFTKAIRQLSNLLELIKDETIRKKLVLWCKPSKLGTLFDNNYDELSSGVKTLGLNVSELMQKKYEHVVAPLLLYCLYRYKQNLDLSPSIIVLNDANLLLANKIFAPMLPNWLDYLTDHNAQAILLCDVGNQVCPNIEKINSKIVTHLFLPDTKAELYQQSLQLSQPEVNIIKGMKLIYRHFMIKQNNETIVAELNLDGMDYAIKALTGGSEAISAMNQAIAEHGDNANIWIIPFYKNLFPKVKLQ